MTNVQDISIKTTHIQDKAGILMSHTDHKARLFITGFYWLQSKLPTLVPLSLWFRSQSLRQFHLADCVWMVSILILATSPKVTSRFDDFPLVQKDLNMRIYIVFNVNCQKCNLLRGFSRENIDILPGFTQGQEKPGCVCACVCLICVFILNSPLGSLQWNHCHGFFSTDTK